MRDVHISYDEKADSKDVAAGRGEQGGFGVDCTAKPALLTYSPLQIKPVQKQTRAGQRTRFKAIVVIGDSEGHVGLGIKTSKEVATAIRAAIIIAKLSVLPIRRGYWGSNLGLPHSLPTKESGKCGSVSVRVCIAVVLHSPCVDWNF